ncbi:polysaccharide deacetylase family protein [Cohnella silvisoli]|uniref:Polysaccharide deacetylase family protein n=1 Tax=Cohnella silvisoli TaxID=2873699 RepID=A0ABV1KNU4_9BACL|nr:polysaccharide deacetylase family protein [Cohnella silvisoli]MCD9020943.1 polysaccharide deacetylase family protein [Cohnella silvisoli]
MNTAQRLGYGKEERLLIVNADDFGLCRSVNESIARLLSDNAICSTTIMMTCSWSADAVTFIKETLPDADIGVHWTLTSEWPEYKWGPLCRSRSLLSLTYADGWFPETTAEVERRADPEEVRYELLAQTEAALKAGLALTHADSHMGSLYGFHSGKDLLPIAFDICTRFGLPIRLPRRLMPVGGRMIPTELQERAKIRVRQADDRGIILPDYVIGPDYQLNFGDTYESVKAEGIDLIRNLLPGVTEWISHPSRLTDELRSFHGEPEKRGMEQRFWNDKDVMAALTEEQVRFIGWKDLQRLQSSLSV